jgi:hypothetical protein
MICGSSSLSPLRFPECSRQSFKNNSLWRFRCSKRIKEIGNSISGERSALSGITGLAHDPARPSHRFVFGKLCNELGLHAPLIINKLCSRRLARSLTAWRLRSYGLPCRPPLSYIPLVHTEKSPVLCVKSHPLMERFSRDEVSQAQNKSHKVVHLSNTRGTIQSCNSWPFAIVACCTDNEENPGFSCA